MKRILPLGVIVLGLVLVACDLPQGPDAGLSELTSRWITGSSAPTADQGVDGDLYMNTATGEVYVKMEGSWRAVGDVTGPQGPAGPGIEYWIHTVEAANQAFISASPYGYYRVSIADSRLGSTDWIDIWTVASDGSWFRLAPVYDSTLGVWYNIHYVYDGSVVYRSAISQLGVKLVIFRAPATLSSRGQGGGAAGTFDAARYFRSRAGFDGGRRRGTD